MEKITGTREALGIAIEIERNGADFYRTAARIHKNDDEARALIKLASMEDDHRKAFERLLASAGKRKAVRPSAKAMLYLQTMADAHGGEGDPLTVDLLGGDETLEEILSTAITMEERSILFHSGLLDVAATPAARTVIVRIIADERAHVVALSQHLSALAK
jgi:rubrerythrin